MREGAKYGGKIRFGQNFFTNKTNPLYAAMPNIEAFIPQFPLSQGKQPQGHDFSPQQYGLAIIKFTQSQDGY